MTLSNETAMNHPFFTRLMIKLGVVERRQGVPDFRAHSQIRAVIGMALTVLVLAVVASALRADNFKHKALESAYYAHPLCKSFNVVDKREQNGNVFYTVDSCGQTDTFGFRGL